MRDEAVDSIDYDKIFEVEPIKPKALFDSEGNPIYHIRAEPIRPNELLYDKNGHVVAIKSKGRLLAILEGEE